jgi:hypothetical protein
MLFKVDENLPVELAELLTDLGHDAKTINDQRLQGVNDRVLLERCDFIHRGCRGNLVVSEVLKILSQKR